MQSEPLKIVPMTPAHVPQIAALERVCFTTAWSERSIAAELENPLSLWLAALRGETLAGYVGSQSVLDEADLMNLAVAPALRRQGIASALLDALERRLEARGVVAVTLEVRRSNLPAQAFYAARGYGQIGMRPNYYANPREDALILQKRWGSSK